MQGARDEGSNVGNTDGGVRCREHGMKGQMWGIKGEDFFSTTGDGTQSFVCVRQALQKACMAFTSLF